MRFLKHSILIVALIAIGLTTHLGLPLESVPNYGFIFGLFEESTIFVRVGLVALALGPIILVALYFYATLAPELALLRWGITLLLGGILGNGVEKLFFGFVFDYIRIDLPYLNSYTFNLSDVSQIFGLGVIVWQLFSRQDQVWFPAVQKRSLIVYPEIQIPALLRILSGAFIANLVQLILTMTLIFPHLEGSKRGDIGIYLLSLLAMGIIIFLILGRLVLKEFLRCLGPVASIERYLESGKFSEPIRFRKSHHFARLEESFNHFLDVIRKERI